jgi:threonine dehydrogenase-like Zn-dependent dehydrogenase
VDDSGPMRATVLTAPGTIELHDVADPRVEQPTDVVVRVVASCVCGSGTARTPR